MLGAVMTQNDKHAQFLYYKYIINSEIYPNAYITYSRLKTIQNNNNNDNNKK